MNKNFTMKGFLRTAAIWSASLFIFSVYGKAAGEPLLPAVKPPIPAAAVAPAGDSAQNSELNTLSPDAAIGHTEFDEFSSVNDPLYREGSKILLQKAIDNDNSPKAPAKKAPVKNAPVKKSLWRDAPAAIPAKIAPPPLIKDDNGTKAPIFPVKKNRLIKLIPADPIETKSTL